MVFVPSGNEFRVNSQTGGDQFASDVATLSNGGFVVVWDDRSGTLGDGSSDSIKAQLYAPSGAPVGREFLVNTRTIGAQSQPSVAALPDGRIIVTWTGVDDGSQTSIQAQIFDNHGFRIGTEFGVNTQLSSSQTMPDVAALADGGFIITWSDAFDTNVKARRFDALGNGLAEFQVNGAAAGLEDSSRVAVQTNAAPVIAWEDESGAHDNSADGIVAHDYISKFNLDFLVNTSTTGPQRVPDVAALAGGGFVVCWQDENSTSGDIKARIFKNGIGGTEFLVNTTTTGMQVDPAITATADGGFVIAWHDHSAGITDANVKAQAFDATAQRSARSSRSIPRCRSTRSSPRSRGWPTMALSWSGPMQAARSATRAGSASRRSSTSCSRRPARRATTASRRCRASIVSTRSAAPIR